jgi:hypothetical protein
MTWPVDITYEPFACGPTVYVGNSVDGSAIATELAPIKADTTHDTMLDDLLVMNYLPKRSGTKKCKLKRSLNSHMCPNGYSGWPGSVVEQHVETMNVR